MAPTDGSVRIERQTESGWEAIETLGTKRRVFTGQVSVPRTVPLRATAGGVHSLTR